MIFFVFVIGDLFLSFLFSSFFLLSVKLTTDRSVERLALRRRRRRKKGGREGGNECRYTREEREIDKSINPSYKTLP